MKHSAAWDRCVRAVGRSAKNPYAVCTASLGRRANPARRKRKAKGKPKGKTTTTLTLLTSRKKQVTRRLNPSKWRLYMRWGRGWIRYDGQNFRTMGDYEFDTAAQAERELAQIKRDNKRIRHMEFLITDDAHWPTT
jgi:hypothetical protein